MDRASRQLINSFIFLAIIAAAWFFPLLGFFIPFCMLLGFASGLFKGRKWCDWYCPRGSFYDVLGRAVNLRKNIPPEFKKTYFRLGVLALLMAVMTVNLILRWPSFEKIGSFFVIMLIATTALGIILALFSHARSWCMICPIGTIINLTGRKGNPLRINSDLCVECKLCSNVCPVQIKPYRYKSNGLQVVSDKDCLSCGACVNICPEKALFFRKYA